ncbi:MAG: hypothetical protein LV481_15990 [Methylacidiphilales bacterium]|nr:hypothetical protein [Candidatus Methylacidiphilales bacterium]
MRKYLSSLSLLLLTSTVVFSDGPVATQNSSASRTLQDPKTKIIYYLESDQRHIAAISPKGKLLWCFEFPGNQHLHINSFELQSGGIVVDGGVVGATLDAKTGAIMFISEL